MTEQLSLMLKTDGNKNEGQREVVESSASFLLPQRKRLTIKNFHVWYFKLEMLSLSLQNISYKLCIP